MGGGGGAGEGEEGGKKKYVRVCGRKSVMCECDQLKCKNKCLVKVLVIPECSSS